MPTELCSSTGLLPQTFSRPENLPTRLYMAQKYYLNMHANATEIMFIL
jgi:hypothetical protein